MAAERPFSSSTPRARGDRVERAALSDVEPDWSREAKRFWSWDPGRSLLASLRAWQRAGPSPRLDRRLLRAVAVLRHRFWSVVSGADLPLATRIGGGLMLPHPNGIVVHPDVVIGVNCIVFQQVTIGTDGSRIGVPILGGRVDIGAGARVLGPIAVGAQTVIGANAVVIDDVPSGVIVAGIPARLVSIAPTGPAS